MGTPCCGEKMGGKKTGACPSGRFAEQRIGSGAVRGSLVAVRLDPGDLRFELCDPLVEFGQRIRIKTFLRQRGGSIAFGPGQVIVHFGTRIVRCGLAVNTPAS